MAKDAAYHQALVVGAETYSTGRLCKNGHVSERYISSRACIACERARRRQWRALNPDLAKTESALYHASAAGKRATKKWRDNNRELRSKLHKKWRGSNMERVRVIQRNRAARKTEAGGSHTAAEVAEILRMQRSRCAVCRTKVRDDYHVDHIIPIARGGNNFRRNLQILCAKCNLSKHARDPIEFMQAQGALL